MVSSISSQRPLARHWSAGCSDDSRNSWAPTDAISWQNVLHFLQAAQAERQDVVQAGTKLTDQSGTHEQPVRRRDRVSGWFLERRKKELTRSEDGQGDS